MIPKTEKEIMKNWKSHEKPLVSICSITYNHEKFIEISLDSILMQETTFPFEIIVRDDCSTDRTASIVREYAEKFPHIITTILETENQHSKGISAFPATFEKTKGKYIAILEGDDYWKDEHKLEKQVAFLDNNEDYVLSYSNSIVVDENNQLVRKIRNPLSKDYTREEMLCGEVMIATNTVMFRKVDLDFKNINNVLGKDIIIWHLLGRYGKSKYQTDVIPSAYREHSGGVWSSLDKVKKLTNFIKTRQELKKLCHDDLKLGNRIDRLMNRQAATVLFDLISSFEFKPLLNLAKLIVQNEDLHIFKTMMLLPAVVLLKIKNRKKNYVSDA